MGLDPRELKLFFHTRQPSASRNLLLHPRGLSLGWLHAAGGWTTHPAREMAPRGRQGEGARGGSTRTLTFLSGCWTNSVEGSLVSSFLAGDLSHRLLWDS